MIHTYLASLTKAQYTSERPCFNNSSRNFTPWCIIIMRPLFIALGVQRCYFKVQFTINASLSHILCYSLYVCGGKVLIDKSHCLAAILATPPGSYFGITRPGSSTFVGCRAIKKTACIESPVKSEKYPEKKFKLQEKGILKLILWPSPLCRSKGFSIGSAATQFNSYVSHSAVIKNTSGLWSEGTRHVLPSMYHALQTFLIWTVYCKWVGSLWQHLWHQEVTGQIKANHIILYRVRLVNCRFIEHGFYLVISITSWLSLLPAILQV